METALSALSVLLGLLSAASWFWASLVKVTHEKAMASRRKAAGNGGEQVNFASVTLDGWDMSATFAAQSKWNAMGAAFGAGSILLQSVPQLVHLLSK